MLSCCSENCSITIESVRPALRRRIWTTQPDALHLSRPVFSFWLREEDCPQGSQWLLLRLLQCGREATCDVWQSVRGSGTGIPWARCCPVRRQRAGSDQILSHAPSGLMSHPIIGRPIGAGASAGLPPKNRGSIHARGC